MNDESDILDTSTQEESLLSYFKQSRIPTPDRWPQSSPVYVVASHRAPDVKYELPCLESDAMPPFPLDGTVVPFDGPLFNGKMISRIKNAPSMKLSPGDNTLSKCPSKNYFKGKSRMFQWIVQGKFKRRLRFDKVVTGQEFDRPFRNAPSATIVRKGIDLLRNRLPDAFEW